MRRVQTDQIILRSAINDGINRFVATLTERGHLEEELILGLIEVQRNIVVETATAWESVEIDDDA